MARLTAFLVWALAAASAVFWGLRVFSQPLAVPAHAQPVAASVGSPAAVARLLAGPAEGAARAAPPAESARFRLLGVMAPPEGRSGGVALISVDGKPPRAVRPGATVAEGLVLQQLGPRSARFGPAGGEAAFTLELPPLPAPQTGRLPPPDLEGNGGGAARTPPPRPPAVPPAGGPPGAGVPPPQEQGAPQAPPQGGEPVPEEPAEEEPSHRGPA